MEGKKVGQPSRGPLAWNTSPALVTSLCPGALRNCSTPNVSLPYKSQGWTLPQRFTDACKGVFRSQPINTGPPLPAQPCAGREVVAAGGEEAPCQVLRGRWLMPGEYCGSHLQGPGRACGEDTAVATVPWGRLGQEWGGQWKPE